MKPITKDAALSRIHRAGLTLLDAMFMSDKELLSFPPIGRRTLRFIRSFNPVQS